MELPSSALAALNALLPPGFLVETPDCSESCHRRNELERLKLDLQLSAPPQQCLTQGEITEVVKLPAGEGFRRLYLILSKLKKHPESAAFLTCPGLNLPSIETRLLQEEYVDAQEFAKDLRRMFAQSPSLTLKAYFEALMTGHESILLTLRKQPKLLPSVQPLTAEEKRNLAEKIRRLDAKYLKGIEEVTQTTLEGKDLMAYLSRLQPSTARGLHEYVVLCLEKAKLQAKPVPERQAVGSEASRPCQELPLVSMPPIKAPVRLGIAGFHELLPKVFR